MTKHAIERAKERYKIDLTEDDLKNIVSLVEEGYAKYSHRAGSVWIYRIRYKHKLLVPALSKDKKTIITFIPREGKAPKFIDKDGIWKQKRMKGQI